MLHHECDCNSCTTIPLNAAKDMKLFGCWRGFPAWTISGASKELEFSAIWSQSMHGTKSLALGTTPDSLSFVLMRGSSSRRHGSGHSCIKEKQKHHHLQFSRLRRQGKGKKKISHTAWKIFQTDLGFLAATDNQLCSMLDERLGGNKWSISHFQQLLDRPVF